MPRNIAVAGRGWRERDRRPSQAWPVQVSELVVRTYRNSNVIWAHKKPL